MIRSFTASALTATLLALYVCPLQSQTADTAVAITHPAPLIYSIGQPPIWRYHLAAQATAFTQTHGGHSGATFSYGIFHSVNKPPMDALNPVLGFIGGTVEGYGTVGGLGDAGLRAMATSRMFAISVGADWDMRHGHVNTIVSWQSAIRRGGILGRGSMVRIDWIPERGQTVRIGLTAPQFDPLAGRTRPRATTITIPDPPQPPVPVVAANDAATERLARDIQSASTA